MKKRATILAALACLAADLPASGQWTHRYPKVEGYRHHVYLEGFELPILAAGPTDPAPSPDGASVAFAARGWLWLLDLATGDARRLTSGASVDARPAWSPDGSKIAFLRDDSLDVDIWQLDLASGEESPLVETEAIDLDPAYSPDGTFLYYSSARAGDLDLWRLQLSTGEAIALTEDEGLEVRPLPLAGGDRVVYLAKGRSSPDRLMVLDLEEEARRPLRTQSILSQTRPGTSADRAIVAVNWPGPEGYDLFMLDPGQEDWIRLTRRSSLPLAPAVTADGTSVYFVEADEDLRFGLYRVPVTGGPIEPVSIRSWNWGEATARLRIRTRLAASASPIPARLAVSDRAGHPVVSDETMPRFDGTHGRVYLYSPGVLEVEVPAGRVSVTAAHGFASPAVSREIEVDPGANASLELVFEPLWNPRAEGWYAGDHHYHMNYGGPYRLHPSDLLLPLRAEDLDVGTPLMANLHHRLNDLEFFAWRHLGEAPLLAFGQEVRSHFLGHLGLIDIHTPYWPWYWGPGYPVYGEDDRPNHEALRFAREQGGVGSYMHPVSDPDPFADEETLGSIPLNLIPDVVMGDLDSLEIACLWVSELGTTALWHRFLNLGIPLAASAGTDSFADYYRSMAVGATRIYVKVAGPLNMKSYLDGLRESRSFVTTGPLVDFTVEGAGPGDVVPVPVPSGEAGWRLRMVSPQAVEAIEILVNGEVVSSLPGTTGPGVREIEGSVSLPSGGWVAVRAHGGIERWPGMNGSPFAQSSPIWIGKKGSSHPEARRRAARDLLRALEVAEKRLVEGYGESPSPKLRARFEEARRKLESLSRERDGEKVLGLRPAPRPHYSSSGAGPETVGRGRRAPRRGSRPAR